MPISTSQLISTFIQPRTKSLNLVLEFLDTDLEAVIKDKTLIFRTEDVKAWMVMTLRGLHFCHMRGVLHRVSGGDGDRVELDSRWSV